MKNKTLVQTALLSALCSLGFATQAADIELKHEYQSQAKSNVTKLKAGHQWDSGFGASAEVGILHGDGKLFKEPTTNNFELDGYYQIGDKWFVKPGMNINVENDGTAIRPYLSAGYHFDSGFYTEGRYRYEDKKISDKNSSLNGKSSEIHRADLSAGYKNDKWLVDATYTAMNQANKSFQFNNGKRDTYEAKLKAGYRMGNWMPFIEVGDLDKYSGINHQGDPVSNKRNYKMELGVNYRF
ncbi:oligogalacturonate-specific porin KdgM family protein [Motilimonas pumila]|uniref:Porin n=1 Tax=Motilimonas pumila TaxID=2303987 RepID=A0A418YIN6_9GAMM|nr:oligogalacturonate-specific porin KdgM family protein [Motilimonas pumila]RJG50490.1 hypothetical protein D1Z90_03145 [Motilimonas pumila]